MTPIVVVDYGMGNLGSILNMFKRIGVKAAATSDPNEISRAEKLLLPGVGAFDAAMSRIHDRGLRNVLDHKATVERVPVLGICLGMQLLTRSSEEGNLAGLGWLAASAHRFPSNGTLKVPHMGWNLTTKGKVDPLTKDLPADARFYFVHSYYVRADLEEDVVLHSNYGLPFVSAIGRSNIWGAQFHPEKSHKFGMKLLENFANL